MGRKRKKDKTESSENHFIGGDAKKDNLAGITDIAELLDKQPDV